MKDNAVVCHSEREGWLLFERPVRVCCARRPECVPAVLNEVQAAADAGLYAAGFMTYDAAPGLDAALSAHAQTRLPLVWFGLYEQPERLADLPPSDASFEVGEWMPSISRQSYGAALGRIREYIRAGDTYQVNYTYRLHAAFQGSAWSFFLALQRGQRARHSAFVRLPGVSVCSVSPELFFALNGRSVVSRPMKGTAPRGLTYEADVAQARALRASEKNRAENIMITDMIRNDLGRIAELGSVRVVRAYEIERYPTVLHMISTVEATTGASLSETMRALFPCASITGAPKVRTMEIIKELEPDPRGLYTGTIGYWGPTDKAGGRSAEFNVAIRTVVVDHQAGRAEYGVGGGIVWDSDTTGEYEECLTKARVLTAPAPTIDLLETMLWTPNDGYVLLDRHVRRLAHSAVYFSFPFDRSALIGKLNALAAGFGACAWRVRLLLSEQGHIALQPSEEPVRDPKAVLRLAFAAEPMDRSTPFLYHKTTCRDMYARARASVPGHDDAMLYNARGEVTETTVANLVFVLNGRKVTPPVECGLLPGTFRAQLLETGEVDEQVVTQREALAAETVFAVNSVRGWMPARLEQGA